MNHWFNRRAVRNISLAAVLTVSGCVSPQVRDTPLTLGVDAIAPMPPPPAPELMASGPSVVGYASWYRRSRVHRRTCTGEPLDDNAMSAASPTLPMGTRARVELLGQTRSVTVVVNDCMPRGRRVIDLSEEAARRLGIVNLGVVAVSVTPVTWADE